MDRKLVYIIIVLGFLLVAGMNLKDWLSTKRKKKEKVQEPATKGKAPEITIPLQLQAYERLAVFLERCRPEALLHRIHLPQAKVQLLQQELINKIRSEFAYNLSQQIYVSPTVWKAVEEVKEQLIHQIIVLSSEIGVEEDGFELQKELLHSIFATDKSPISMALVMINEESQKLL